MKNFISTLESKLVVSEITFEEFDKGLWFYLCAQSKKQLRQLANSLKIKGKYLSDTNIGNIRLEVINKLGIDFMLPTYEQFNS